jgi:pimeloyl-ACP methyl ester carboxylesterase
MAAHLADAGGVVLAIDHLGTGASTPLDDTFLLTPEILAAAGHAAFTELFGRLRKGSLLPGLPAVGSFLPIGLGHSMGAMITIVQQAHYETYGAVVNLGATGTGLPEHLRDPQWAALELNTVRASLVDLARAQFGVTETEDHPVPLFHADDVPRSVRTAFRGQQTNLLPSSALASLLPSFTDLERGAVSVPLFLAFSTTCRPMPTNPFADTRHRPTSLSLFLQARATVTTRPAIGNSCGSACWPGHDQPRSSRHE